MNGWRNGKRQNSSQQPNLPGLFAPLVKSRRLATPREQALEVARPRLIAAAAIFALIFAVIDVRLACLTLLKDPPEPQAARPELNTSVASRADITDRNGVVLATSLPTTSVCADTRKLLNPDEAAKELRDALPDLDAKRLKADLHSGKTCVTVARHLTPKELYAVNKLGIAGLEFLPDEHRIYPAGNVTAHVVGYTDIDDNGLAGMEKALNTRLEDQQAPVALSIDLRVQNIMHSELYRSMKTFHAIGAAGLVMDMRTGELLAMVSLPDFDPQHAGEATDAQLFNRDTLGVYEMGSTFKIFNTALALDSGLIHVGDQFDVTHPIEIGGHTIRDFEPEKRWLNVAEIFTNSSNIGSAYMAEKLGVERQRAFLTALGLTDKVSLELPEVGAPLVPSLRDWGPATLMTIAFGHGIAVNAVQLAGAAATIVNNGIPVHPTLLKRTTTPADHEEPVISARTSAYIRALMRLVVTRGTAKGSDVPGYMLGGKTGTADKLNAAGHYSSNARLSSFIGVFPINAPKYLVFTMLDDPKGNAKTSGFATGGWVAAPVASRVISQIGPLLDLAPMDPDMEEAAERQVLRPISSQIVDGLPVYEGPSYASVETDRR